MENKRICIDKDDLMNLIYFSRRYCDGRSTYAPHLFNDIYKKIRSEYPDFIRNEDKFDETLTEKGIYYPYAQDGMHDGKFFDATKTLKQPS